MKVIFFGTPAFASETLRVLIDNGIDIVAVVTKPDKPVGRSGKPVPCPVKSLAQERIPHIPLFQPEKASTPQFVETLRSFHADLFVVVAYGEIISQDLLDLPQKGCINVHASLLPKYRGAAPIQWALINGESETGVTVQMMDEKLDSGDILTKKRIPIHINMTSDDLYKIILPLGADMLMVGIPYVAKPTREELFDYYKEICGAVSLPVIVQDTAKSDALLSVDFVWRMYQELDNIHFVKAEGQDFISKSHRLLERSKGTLGVIGGAGGSHMIHLLRIGITSFMTGTEALDLHSAVVNAFLAGDEEGAP